MQMVATEDTKRMVTRGTLELLSIVTQKHERWYRYPYAGVWYETEQIPLHSFIHYFTELQHKLDLDVATWVYAIIFLDRVFQAHIPFTLLSRHTLLLSALYAARRWVPVDQDKAHLFWVFVGLNAAQCIQWEKQFGKLMGDQWYVSKQQFDHYYKLLVSSLCPVCK